MCDVSVRDRVGCAGWVRSVPMTRHGDGGRRATGQPAAAAAAAAAAIRSPRPRDPSQRALVFAASGRRTVFTEFLPSFVFFSGQNCVCFNGFLPSFFFPDSTVF